MKRLAILVATLFCLLAPSVAFAYNPLDAACNGHDGGKPSSTACSTNGSDPLTGKNGVFKRISMLLAVLAGATAVIIIIVSGFQYVTANGDAQKAASARNAIIGSLVGLAIIAASTSIVIFVVSKL